MSSQPEHERRKSRRFRVKDTVFITFRPGFERLGKLVDISRDGIAFDYVPYCETECADMIEADIFSQEKTVYISRIPCKVVYDSQADYYPTFAGLETRRCGLEFQCLSDKQTEQIESLLFACASCAVSSTAVE